MSKSDSNTLSDLERLWGPKKYEKVLSCVEKAIITPNIAEKIANGQIGLNLYRGVRNTKIIKKSNNYYFFHATFL